jgi:hypothetical protein
VKRLALACVVAALLLGRALLPLAVERTIEWQGTAQLGRVVEVGNVDLALLPGSIRIEQIAVGPIFHAEEPPDLDPETAHFRSERIDASWGWLALLEGEIRIEKLEVDAPALLVVKREQGELVPVLQPADEPESAPEPTADEQAPDEQAEGDASWPLRLDALDIADLEVVFVDRSVPGRHPFELSIEQLSLAELSVRDDEVHLGSLGLAGPRLRVLRDIDLAPFLAAGEPEAPAEEPTPSPAAPEAPAEAEPAPTRLHLADFSVERANFVLVVGEEELDTSLSLHLTDVSTDVGARFPVEFHLGLKEGSLDLAGEAGLQPILFQGTLAWSGLPLRTLVAAVAGEGGPQLESGSSSGALEIDVLIADVPERGPSRIDVSGRVGVDRLEAEVEGARLAWSSLEIVADAIRLRPDGEPGRGEQGRPAAPEVELAAIRLRDPVVRVQRSALTASPDDADSEASPSEHEEAESEAGPAPRVRLALLEVTGGQAEFIDETVKPRHRSRLHEVEVRGRDLRWPESDAKAFSLRARGPGPETALEVDAELARGKGRVKLALEQLRLPAFSPYAADAAGYWIETGSASLHASLGIAENGYDLDSDLELVHLAVAEVTPGSFEREFGVPIDLALALLRDASGKIGVPIKLSVSEDQSRVSLRPIIVATLRQALTGALTSPLKGVGMLLGSADRGGGMRIEPVAMAPGSTVPLADGVMRAVEFASVLELRPGLAVRLRGRAGPDDDPLLAERILAERVVAKQELPPVDAGFFQKRRVRGALEKREQGEKPRLEPKDERLLERWASQVEVPDERRAELATARAEALRAALLDAGVDPERVQIGESEPGPPGVEIELAPARK